MKTLKTVFLSLLLTLSMSATAQEIGNVRFGSAQSEAITNIKALFGEPATSTTDGITYKNKTYAGMTWNEIHFNFKDGVLSEARFYMNAKNKAAALQQMAREATAMGKSNVMTKDYEDDGTPFYAGGKSPDGYGHLFTIFASPRAGRWTSQLRFGPFSVKNN